MVLAWHSSSSESAYDAARKASGTDYAKSQGLRVYYSHYSYWTLRSPYYSSSSICCVYNEGYTSGGYALLKDIFLGFRKQYLMTSYFFE